MKQRSEQPSVQDEVNASSLSANVRRIHGHLLKHAEAKFSESDQSFKEWMALRLFAEGLVETAGDLAREFGIATGATTRLIDSLQEQGFIARESKEGDRRVVLLRLTKRGALHYQKKLPHLLACWNEVLVGWEKDEVDQLTKLLEKLQSSFARVAAK